MCTPKVAVLLAVYNGMEWIQAQLDSIINQQGVEVAIFISVDPSTDASESFCRKAAVQHQNIVVLPDVGKFGGAANNFFRLIRDVDFSNFDFISFADQDDIWFEDKLIRAVNKITKTESDAYSSNVLAFWAVGEKKLIEKSQLQREWDYLFEAAGPGCTYVMSPRLALKIKESVINNWLEVSKLGLHDWYFYAFARANGFSWYIDPSPTMFYRQHANNQVGVNIGWRAFIHRFYKILDGWGIDQSLLIAKLVGKVNSDFVKSWSTYHRYGFLILALNSRKCRRKGADCISFFFVCIFMAIVGR